VWAARILVATRDPRAVEPLITRLRDRHDALRAASAEALGMIGDQRALQLLMQVALRDPAPLVRAQAASAVARIAGEEASDVLIAALGDSDYATRLRAL
jgi:HEAT repeat protein